MYQQTNVSSADITMLFSSNCIRMFAWKISILSVIFHDSEFCFKIHKYSWILRIFKIDKICILSLRAQPE